MDYSFRLLDVANAPLISLDTVVTGHVNLGLDATLYRLPVTPGQLLEYDGILGDGPRVRTVLFDVANGQKFNVSTDSDSGPTYVDLAGTDLVAVQGNGSTVDFSFRFFDVATAPVLPWGRL